MWVKITRVSQLAHEQANRLALFFISLMKIYKLNMQNKRAHFVTKQALSLS